MGLLACKIGDIRDDQAEDNLDGSIVDEALTPCRDHSNGEPDANSSNNEVEQAGNGLPGCGRIALHDHAQSKLKAQQAGCIVDEAFPFEDVDDPSWQAE